MQRCGGSREKSPVAAAAAAAAHEMTRWKLHSNPYYYASAARAAAAQSAHPFRINRDAVRNYCAHARKEMEKLQCCDVAAAKNAACKDLCRKSSPTPGRSSRRDNQSTVRKKKDNFCQAGGLNTVKVDALQKELQKVWAQVQELEEACIWARMEIKNLQLRVDSERKSWTSKMYENFSQKILASKEEIAGEERSQHELRLQIEQLEKQLTESKTALIKAKEDIRHERKSKELLQLACAELSHKFGEDKLEMQKLTEDSMQAITHQEEAGRTRETWSHEKLLVKLTQAKLELPQQNRGNVR